MLDARASQLNSTPADLYDPDLMLLNRSAARTVPDRAVDRFYRPASFPSDRERMEHLSDLCENMAALLLVTPKKDQRPS